MEMYRLRRICSPFVAVLSLGKVAAHIAMQLAVAEKTVKPQIDRLYRISYWTIQCYGQEQTMHAL